MKDFEREYTVFEKALKIEEPWYVTHYDLDESEDTLHIYLNFERGAKFVCPHCGSAKTKIHDVTNDNRTWRHMDFWQFKTLLHARMPRVKCELCGKTRTVVITWSRPGAGFTLLFESELMTLMKEMPVKAVARKVGEHDTRLWRVFHYYVNRAMNELDFSSVKRIAIDETSARKGHDYITLFVDIDSKRILFATEGKDSNVLKKFKQFLEEKGIDFENITEVCSDMSPAFKKGVETEFPKASITYDKFHVMKIVNEALDAVRRAEQQEDPVLKKTRYLWLKNEQNLSEKQKATFLNLKDTNLKTARAYRLKLSLQNLWTKTKWLAPIYFDEWYQWAVRSQLKPMVKAAKSLKEHKSGILRWFTTNMTNGFLEGINSLIQAAKRKARGYRTTENFIAMAYATVNKLDINVEPLG